MFHRALRLRIIAGILLLHVTALGAESMSKAPTNVQAALFTKLLAQNKRINRGGDVTIYVVRSPKFAAAMKLAVGKKIGKSRLTDVVETDVPDAAVSGLGAVYIGDEEKWPAAKAYCRKYKVLSISGLPKLVGKGVTLSVGASKNKPKVILDLSASKAEDIDWDPKILKIATLINKR